MEPATRARCFERIGALDALLVALVALVACGGRPATSSAPGARESAAVMPLAPAPRAGVPRAHEAPRAGPAAAACVVPRQRGVSEGLAVEAFEVEADAPGLRCCAYLRRSRSVAAAGTRDTRIALFANGTGVYTTAHGDLDGVARAAGKNGELALLSVDKPGVGATPEGLTTLDRAVFDRHTLADLVACTRNAVDAARARPGVSRDARLVAHGHSEGAQVWVRVLAAALARGDTSFAASIDANVLSGLPLEPVASGAERQLGVFLPFEVEAFRRALAAHDDDYLVLLGMPWRYLEHPTARESTGDVIERLARPGAGVRLEVFHGEGDRNAPFAPVAALVARHAKARHEGLPAVDLRLHAYPGANHQLDARLDADLDALVSGLKPSNSR